MDKELNAMLHKIKIGICKQELQILVLSSHLKQKGLATEEELKDLRKYGLAQAQKEWLDDMYNREA